MSEAALEQMAALYPGLMAEPQYLALLESGAGGSPMKGQAGARKETPPPGVPPSGGPAALCLLRTFCESYLPVTVPLVAAADIEAMLGRVAATLEVFGRSFIELRSGCEEFGKEVGVSAINGAGALYRARDAKQLLAHVLEPGADARDGELRRAFAELMIHQVALLPGVAAGARAILARLSPEAVAAAAQQRTRQLRAPALWKAYEERFHEIADEESAVSAILFGKEFARAYSAIVGRRARDESERDGEPPSSEPEPQPDQDA